MPTQARQVFGIVLELTASNRFVRPARYRNVPVVLAVIFVNPKADAAENVLISGDISITKPDGKITKLPKLELSKGKLMGSPYNLRLGQPAGYIVEDSDPKGKYVINAIVRDNNRNVELSLRTFFTID